MKSQLPPTGTEEFLELLSPFVPDDFLNERWPRFKTGGRRHHLSAAQLWRLHLLVLLTPVHSFNLLIRMLPEQKSWRHFARLRSLALLPDVRMMNAFRDQLGVSGFRQINRHLLEPLVRSLDPALPAVALIDATDLPAACCGFKKKHRAVFGPRCSPGRTHAQERAKSVFCRLQKAYLSPLDFEVYAGSLVGAPGQLGRAGQCFGGRHAGAQPGLLCAPLGLAAGLRGGRHGLYRRSGQKRGSSDLAGGSDHPHAPEHETGAAL